MKNLQVILIALFLIGFSSTVQAQSIVQPEELNGQFLKETFDNLFIEVLETEDSYIKINNDYGYYLDIDAEKRWILINVSFKLSDKATKDNVQELLEIINKDVAMVKVYTDDEYKSITYNYYFWTSGGFTKKSLFEATKLFKLALNLCLEKDTKGVL